MDTLGVVAVVDGGEFNLYFLEVLNGILEGATAHGQNTTVFSLRSWSDLTDHVHLYCDGRVDGLIFLAASIDNAAAEPFLHRGLPFVVIHNSTAAEGIWSINADNCSGSHEIVRHLIAQGHRRILHLSGEIGCKDTTQRLEGYCRALEEAGIAFNHDLVITGKYSTGSGRDRMREILKTGTFNPLPTAIFCGSDAIAAGCIEALCEHGIRVPDDVSVVGFDDTLSARLTNPPLTTVRQPFRMMGRRSVGMLMQQINGDAPVAASEVLTNASAGVSAAHLPQPKMASTEAGSLSYKLGESKPSSSLTPGVEIFDVELVVRGSVGPLPTQTLSPPYTQPNI